MKTMYSFHLNKMRSVNISGPEEKIVAYEIWFIAVGI